MSYNLFLDDERLPRDVYWVKIPQVDYVIVRNLEQFKAMITERGLPEYITFDHDLADWHYTGDFLDERTGYDAAKWLVEYCMDHNLDLPRYDVHSMNPAGCLRIRTVLESYNKHRIEAKLV